MITSPCVSPISECFIKPRLLLEEHKNPIHLSPWDLAMLPLHYIQRGLLYPKHNLNSASSSNVDVHTLVEHLKVSLAVALVKFYPLAGQLKSEPLEDDMNMAISCFVVIDPTKGPGAKFIHAAAVETSISDILSLTTGDYNLPRVVHGFFDPERAFNQVGHNLPLLTIQVTELLDGIIIGCSMNHVCGDGTSFWQFFNSWSEIFMNNLNSKATVDPDSLTNSIICSTPPPIPIQIHTRLFINDESGAIITIPYTDPSEFIYRFQPIPSLVRERIFRFSSESIRKIKSTANTLLHGTAYHKKISSFQALSALVWRCITRVRKIPPDEETKCRLFVNNRRRLDPPLPDNYFGNCIQIVQTSGPTAGELLQQSLGWAALKLNQIVTDHTDKEVRDGVAELAKVLKLADNKMTAVKNMFRSTCNDVVFGDSPRFDMYGNQFGMGKPVAVLCSGSTWYDGEVTCLPGREESCSIDLHICLRIESMLALENDDEFIANLE